MAALTDKINGDRELGGKMMSRSTIYSKFEPHTEHAIETLVAALDKGNWATRVGAAKTILNKLVPDLRAMELGNENGLPFFIQLIQGGYVPRSDAFSASPKGGNLQLQPEIQDSSLASASPQDDNSINGTDTPKST